MIDRSLRALVSQQVDDEFEVIVVCSGSDGTFERVRDDIPDGAVRPTPRPRPARRGAQRRVVDGQRRVRDVSRGRTCG